MRKYMADLSVFRVQTEQRQCLCYVCSVAVCLCWRQRFFVFVYCSGCSLMDVGKSRGVGSFVKIIDGLRGGV